jgi:hypothetical protein
MRIDCSETQFSMVFSPMASRRCGKLIFLTLGQQRAAVVAGNGGLSPLSLSDGDRLLWWFSNDEEGTDGSGGPRGRCQDGRLNTGGSTPAWRRARVVVGIGQDFMKSRITDALFLGENDLRRRGRGV